jgi:hypothetical protein
VSKFEIWHVFMAPFFSRQFIRAKFEIWQVFYGDNVFASIFSPDFFAPIYPHQYFRTNFSAPFFSAPNLKFDSFFPT